jgi:S-methylmethionine-dependent homocysteine/selenocysteine methylase
LTQASVKVCQKALAGAAGTRYIAGSLAPLADCYHPEKAPEPAVAARVHAATAAWLHDAGCHLILVETMGAQQEAVIAVRAARRTGIAAVLASFITDASGTRLLSGEPLLVAAKAVLGEGADGVLINCVHAKVVGRALAHLQPVLPPVPPPLCDKRADAGILLGGYANACRMHFADGEPMWERDDRPLAAQAAAYAGEAMSWVKELGVRVLGSCCGTTPEHIRQLAQARRDGTGA